MSAYKQEFVDNYWKEDAQVIQESMGFYWAMRSRDFVPFIARVFKKHMYVFKSLRLRVVSLIQSLMIQQLAFKNFKTGLI